jgi:hypothetical protein
LAVVVAIAGSAEDYRVADATSQQALDKVRETPEGESSYVATAIDDVQLRIVPVEASGDSMAPVDPVNARSGFELILEHASVGKGRARCSNREGIEIAIAV